MIHRQPTRVMEGMVTKGTPSPAQNWFCGGAKNGEEGSRDNFKRIYREQTKWDIES